MAVAVSADPGLKPTGSPGEVLRVFLKLGLTSFGGPIAHMGYFREEFVVRRRWIEEAAYSDLVALCQFLPGPASSQVGLSLGLIRAGYWGGLAAWTGFTLPSAILLTAFAYGAGALREPLLPRAQTLSLNFDHRKHTAINCLVCHHNYADGRGFDACIFCHRSARTDLKVGVEARFHDFCLNCHRHPGPTLPRHGPVSGCTICHQPPAM